jgi:Putative metallopeptidase
VQALACAALACLLSAMLAAPAQIALAETSLSTGTQPTGTQSKGAQPAQAPAIDVEARDAFVSNVLIHIMHHEAGHALVDLFDVPVIGQEEDAVDGYATLSILETYTDPQSILIDAAAGWFAMHDQMIELGEEPYYFGEHDLDVQRAYRIICHAYGYAPDQFEEAAREVELPDDRLETCTVDSQKVLDGWDRLLEDAYRAEDTPGGNVELVFKDAPNHRAAKLWLEETGLMKEIADWLDVTYDWPEPLKVTAEACGEANAYYFDGEPTITMCYEMVDYLMELAKDVVE